MLSPSIDEVGRLIGDPSRAAMLLALMDGRAWTGTELAAIAHVGRSTASEHVQRLVDAGLLGVVPQGRHRYYHIASQEVAQALEALAILAQPMPVGRHLRKPIDPELRRARTCYDHLAGELGVVLAEAMARRTWLRLDHGSAVLTPSGEAFFGSELGIVLNADTARRPLCRTCVDWSERRIHLAGRAGAALARHAFDREWVRRKDKTRAVAVTPNGVVALRDLFDVEWEE
jgi:DNA-binding transcriptional ArsR family regulator